MKKLLHFFYTLFKKLFSGSGKPMAVPPVSDGITVKVTPILNNRELTLGRIKYRIEKQKSPNIPSKKRRKNHDLAFRNPKSNK